MTGMEVNGVICLILGMNIDVWITSIVSGTTNLQIFGFEKETFRNKQHTSDSLLLICVDGPLDLCDCLCTRCSCVSLLLQ